MPKKQRNLISKLFGLCQQKWLSEWVKLEAENYHPFYSRFAFCHHILWFCEHQKLLLVHPQPLQSYCIIYQFFPLHDNDDGNKRWGWSFYYHHHQLQFVLSNVLSCKIAVNTLSVISTINQQLNCRWMSTEIHKKHNWESPRQQLWYS